jgi:hypothetical protein
VEAVVGGLTGFLSGQQPLIPSWSEPGSVQVNTERPGHPQGAEVEIPNTASLFRTRGERLLTVDSHLGRVDIAFLDCACAQYN